MISFLCTLSCCHPGEGGTAQPEAAAGESALRLFRVHPPPGNLAQTHRGVPGDVGRDRDHNTAVLDHSLLNSCTIYLLSLPQDLFHCQIMDGNLSRNLETYFPLIGNTLHPNQLLRDHGAGVALRWGPTAPHSAVAGWGCGAALGSPCPIPREGCMQGCLGQSISHSLPRSYPDCTGARAARARQPWGVELPLHLRAPGVPRLHWLRGVRVCPKR